MANMTFQATQCPQAGVPAGQGCRCNVCRPDLHWATNFPRVNTTVVIPPGSYFRWPAAAA